MVGLFENQSIHNSIFKHSKSGLVWYSDPHCICFNYQVLLGSYAPLYTIDKQLPVFLVAIRLRLLDFKHLIPGNGPPELQGSIHVTVFLYSRGWLNEEETRELMAMLEEDDCSLHGVIMAAGLLAVSRILQDDRKKMVNCHEQISLRVSNEMNLRQYCVVASQKMLGSHTTYYETDCVVPPIQDRIEFWKFAHELTVKHNASKGNSCIRLM